MLRPSGGKGPSNDLVTGDWGIHQQSDRRYLLYSQVFVVCSEILDLIHQTAMLLSDGKDDASSIFWNRGCSTFRQWVGTATFRERMGGNSCCFV